MVTLHCGRGLGVRAIQHIGAEMDSEVWDKQT